MRGGEVRIAASFVLFDLDGTLVDSAPDIAVAVDAMLERLGRPAPGLEQVREWVGDGAARLVKRALTGTPHGEPDPELFRRAHSLFLELYGAGLCVHTRAFPGAQETLAALRARGIRTGCVTNKPVDFAQRLSAELGLLPELDVLVGAAGGLARKPDAEPLLEAGRRLGLPAREGVMVGDSVLDVEAAHAAGMPAVAVTYGYNSRARLRRARPELLVDSLAELAAALEPVPA